MVVIYERIKKWIADSKGKPIKLASDIDERYFFLPAQKISEKELSDFEKQLGRNLPQQYKDFLLNIGEVELFSRGIEFLSPKKVAAFSQVVFNNSGIEDPYPELFLAVSIPVTGYFAGFDLTNEDQDNNFAVFFADVPPELWMEEAEFTSFNAWLSKLVLSNSMELF